MKIQIFQKPFELNLKLVLCNDALYLSVCQIICLFNANNGFCPKIRDTTFSFMFLLFLKFLSLKVLIAVLLSWNSKLRNNIIYNSLQNSSMEVESIWERSRMPWPSFYMLSTTFTISKVESFFSGRRFRTEHCLQLHKYFQQNSTSKVPFCCKWMCQIQHTK